MNENKPYLFIADAHIMDSPEPDGGFFDMLEKISQTDYNIVFMGDIFELWIAFDAYETEVHKRFLTWCRKEKSRRIVGFIEGNHEFYVSYCYPDAFSWVTDRSKRIATDRVCLMHGDTINEADYGYRILRLILRNPLSRFLVWLFGPLIGKVLSEKIRISLKHKNLKHKKNLPEKYFCKLAEKMKEEDIPVCILGHFHETSALRGIQVLPAWGPDGEIGRYDPETDRLQIVPWKTFLNQENHSS